MGPGVPCHVCAAAGDVVAVAGGDGNGHHGAELQSLHQSHVVSHDLVVASARVVHQVHLVHGKQYVADAQQVDDVGVTLGLGEHSLAGVDQQQGEVGR